MCDRISGFEAVQNFGSCCKVCRLALSEFYTDAKPCRPTLGFDAGFCHDYSKGGLYNNAEQIACKPTLLLYILKTEGVWRPAYTAYIALSLLHEEQAKVSYSPS